MKVVTLKEIPNVPMEGAEPIDMTHSNHGTAEC